MRKTIGAAAVLVAGALAVWLLFLRRHEVKQPVTEPAKPVAAAPAKPAAPAPEAPAPHGIAPKWTLDTDPEGPLRLEGQVLDADGHGVAGAEVWLDSVPARSTKSGEDGGFAFDNLVGRAYELTAHAQELVGGPVNYKLTATSDPAIIAMRAGATVEVTVTDGTQPIEGADVKIHDDHDRGAKTDAQGHATLAGVHPGWIELDASAPGYAQGEGNTSIGAAGGKGKTTIALKRGVAVSGRVIDEAGHPIAKARVTAGEAWGWRRGGGEQTTDERGQFAFTALAPGGYSLAVVDGEHAPAISPPITVSASRAVTGVEVVMKAGASIRGTVVDADGKLVRYATVRVSGKGGEAWRTTARQATTDTNGKFELRGLPRALLQARAESDAAASALAELDTAKQPALHDVKLVLDVTGTIAGVVVDEKNQPVAEVQVHAFPDVLAGESPEGLALAGMSSATTDGGGHFTIRGLPAGAYRLWAARHATESEGWGKQNTAAKVGDKAVRITLSAPGVLVGKLQLESGTAPKVAYVQVAGEDTTPAVDGAFRIEELAPGPYDLRVFGPEFSEYVQRDVKIDAGKTTDVGTLTVVRGRRLLGHVVDPSGAPVAGAHVKLGEMLFSSGTGDDESESMDDVSGMRTAVTDQDGAFAILGVPRKPTTVMADHPDRGRSLPMAIADGTGDPPPIVLALRGYGAIVGKVVQKGEPQGNVTISESSKGGGAAAAFVQTAADGTFTMPKVPEGTHVIMAMQPQMMSMKSTSATVQVTAGKTTNVTIDIPVGTLQLTVAVKALPGNEVDAAQVFLLNGTVNVANGKQLLDGFFQGAMQGMKFWFGEGKPAPEFDELVAGDYSVCTIPITGNLTDPQFMQRIQENMQSLAVYCKPVKVAPSPQQQTFVDAVPAMSPLPSPKS